MKTTKLNKILLRAALAIVALVFVSGCLFATTLARYTTRSTLSGTATIAEWKIDITKSDNSELPATLEFGDLSPSKAAYSYDEGTDTLTTRSNKATYAVKVANAGAVKALVTLNCADTSKTLTARTGKVLSTLLASKSFDEDDIKGLFTIAFFEDEATTTEIDEDGFALNAGESKTIYAAVTWTTADTKTDDEIGDEIDTFVGENIASIAFEIVIKAVQDSQIPA